MLFLEKVTRGPVAAIVVEIVTHDPAWLGWVSLPLALAPIAFALSRTVPNAVQLGRDSDAPPEQLRLARSVLRDHIFCVSSIATLMAVQLVAAA